MPPTEPSDAHKRARILEAAFEVCAADGVIGARMDDVAARAQVSKGTLYRFFASKEDLFLATLIDSYEQGLRLVDPRVDAGSEPLARLEHVLDGLTKVLAAIAPRMDVHYQAWGVVAKRPELKERLYGFLRAFHASRVEEIRDSIRDGQRDGVFRADADPLAFADAITGLLSGFLYRATFDPLHATPERLRASFAALVRDALVVGGGDG